MPMALASVDERRTYETRCALDVPLCVWVSSPAKRSQCSRLRSGPTRSASSVDKNLSTPRCIQYKSSVAPNGYAPLGVALYSGEISLLGGAGAITGRTINRLLRRHCDRTISSQRFTAKGPAVKRDASKCQDLSDKNMIGPNSG